MQKGREEKENDKKMKSFSLLRGWVLYLNAVLAQLRFTFSSTVFRVISVRYYATALNMPS